MNGLRWVLTLGLWILMAQFAWADDVVETIGQASVNWTTGFMVFTGDGAPNLKAPNAAAARLGAERAAQLTALRNALETLKGLKLSAGMTVGEHLQKTPAMQAEVEGVIRGFIVAETRYYSDGGVQRDLKVPVNGVLSQTLLKGQFGATPGKPCADKGKQPAAAKTEKPVTGLVVLAKGLAVMPALAPKVLDESGQDVYSVAMVAEADLKNGVARYMKEEKVAGNDPQVAGNPLVVKAVKADNSVDLVVSNVDAERIRKAAAAASFLTQGRVIIVKD